MNTYIGDADFIDVMGFHMAKGRTFNRDLASDSLSVVLNESAVNALGLEDPIGAEFNDGRRVIGVVSNFHFESLKKSHCAAAFSGGKELLSAGISFT